ncbi:hypothetical protein P691DRAFT_714633 [Macrolepiota fuliginosa MF-IS2]|uniref:BTB domain-containing protein n=1 Tax=Macrolepiota fuliginosa MF-IS2 TaxID=1400762 RepID=A0A9P6BVT7_9AGAR|nr:hypothetical protein P691DRAFT_714633 [Macrolepiota fuliginosa MF-IS2]
MGNQTSSSAGPTPASSRYQSSTIPDSFFATTSTSSTSEKPPPYDTARHSSIKHADVSKSTWTRIVFTSSDQKYFSLARKDVEAHTGALIPEGRDLRGVTLPETSTTLSTLFEFIGAQKHPKLLNENFESLAEIARAAEKYKVYSAMNTCCERMRAFGDHHPKLVLLYAAYNDYPHIFDECAPRVVTSEKLEEFVPLLPDEFRLPWLRYHAIWSSALTEIISYKDIPADAWTKTCLWFGCWTECGGPIFHGLGAGVHSLNDISHIFTNLVESHTKKCESCKTLCTKWEAHASSVVEKIGVFTETCMTLDPLTKAKK